MRILSPLLLSMLAIVPSLAVADPCEYAGSGTTTKYVFRVLPIAETLVSRHSRSLPTGRDSTERREHVVDVVYVIEPVSGIIPNIDQFVRQFSGEIAAPDSEVRRELEDFTKREARRRLGQNEFVRVGDIRVETAAPGAGFTRGEGMTIDVGNGVSVRLRAFTRFTPSTGTVSGRETITITSNITVNGNGVVNNRSVVLGVDLGGEVLPLPGNALAAVKQTQRLNLQRELNRQLMQLQVLVDAPHPLTSAEQAELCQGSGASISKSIPLTVFGQQVPFAVTVHSKRRTMVDDRPF